MSTRLTQLAARTQRNPSPLPWLQRTGQVTDDSVLNVEVVDLLIHLRFRVRDRSPQDWEVAAEQPVRTGLAFVDAVSRLSAVGESLLVRVEIATGLLVSGNLLGSAHGRATQRRVQMR
ncbi:hypothetical protein KBI52_06860 [Microvirga sp. HBU67558]|uniref:hypothetical protein n=1 Tax=Microvirga TaxID=186650 RepID=UPI001B377DA7|nr:MULTISPECIES: hypothetical protein [unclassified Microvirga]MBQ0819936.1 hypothetical protein [Microvirga sp. HBU67558]